MCLLSDAKKDPVPKGTAALGRIRGDPCDLMSGERMAIGERTYLTEVRCLDGLATLRFTSSGDLYIGASTRGIKR